MQEFDIRDFGAVGDGETVNTAAIQAAVDACADDGHLVRYVRNTILVPARMAFIMWCTLSRKCQAVRIARKNDYCIKNVNGLFLNNTTFDPTDEEGEMEYYTE